uniref:Uncharacterized protein n=2 Tax=Helianthus annuus TaxID=4232 RepID=A0A251UPV2_HELAN
MFSYIFLVYEMSGAGSSSGAGGRKRGPQTMPRGTSEQPPLPPDFGKRKIEYRAYPVIPHGRSTRLKDSPLL